MAYSKREIMYEIMYKIMYKIVSIEFELRFYWKTLRKSGTKVCLKLRISLGVINTMCAVFHQLSALMQFISESAFAIIDISLRTEEKIISGVTSI